MASPYNAIALAFAIPAAKLPALLALAQVRQELREQFENKNISGISNGIHMFNIPTQWIDRVSRAKGLHTWM